MVLGIAYHSETEEKMVLYRQNMMNAICGLGHLTCSLKTLPLTVKQYRVLLT